MNEFQKRYVSFDVQQLVKIIEDADNYNPIAVEAAKLELSKREISAEEIQSIKDNISDKKAKSEERQQQVKQLENKAKNAGATLLDSLSPIQKTPQTLDRKINLISIIFGLLAIYHIIEEYGMLKFMITDSYAKWDFSMVIYFLPVIFLSVGIFNFWKRNKIGWFLLSIHFTYNIAIGIGMFLLTRKWQNEILIPQPNPLIYLCTAAFFGLLLWIFCKADIRNEYRVDSKSAIITIVATAILTMMTMTIYQ